VVGYYNRFDVFVLNVNRKRLIRDVDRRFQIRNLTAPSARKPGSVRRLTPPRRASH
jgi:hypothetical protein